jgi:hypothetical protein
VRPTTLPRKVLREIQLQQRYTDWTNVPSAKIPAICMKDGKTNLDRKQVLGR